MFKKIEFRFDEDSLTKFRTRERRIVNNLRCYYNFYNNEKFELRSFVLSEHKKSITVKSKDIYDRVELDVDLGPEDIVKKKRIDFSYLLAKTKKIKELLNKSNLNVNRTYLFNNFCQLTKSKCKNCHASCTFKISQLMDDSKKIKVKDLKNELKRHKHPMGRIINKKVANKEQKINELIQHYENVHCI
jgi:hypothetical protein